MFTRRHVLKSGLSILGGGLIYPRMLRATTAAGQRKFLFVLAKGGWDQTCVFAPLFDSEHVDMPQHSDTATAHGISYVDGEGRENVRTFLDAWGDRCAIINGFEARSVAHDTCLRLVMTGTPQPNGDDWPSRIASFAAADMMMPMVHISGPSYTYECGSSVVRVGNDNQLSSLLSGAALEASDMRISAPLPEVEALEDAAVRARITRLIESATGEGQQMMYENTLLAQDRLANLTEMADSLDLARGTELSDRMAIAINCMEAGASRCAFIGDEGRYGVTWDTHAGIEVQNWNFDDLFGALSEAMDQLSLTTSPSGGTLLEETTVVVLSEMGRFPKLNSRGGKEHWTYTSALLIGSGIKGGQVIGGYDEYCGGQTIDLASGEVASKGIPLLPGHIGATLLTLADIDPGEYISDGEPITAVMASP